MNEASILFNQINPMHVFAVRALASLDTPDTKAEMLRHRTAFKVTLEAAGVDMSNLSDRPKASFKDTHHHALVCWYDMTSGALRLFAPSLDDIDETTVQALELLSSTVIGNWEDHEIEDVDAAIRMMALMGTGGGSAAELHARHVVPNEDRWDEDFTAPTVEDLEELWCTWRAYYIGGSGDAPNDISVWVSQTYAFGI